MRVFSLGGHTKHRREWNTRTVPGLSTAVLQQIGGVLTMFYDVIYLSTLTPSCRETDVKAMLFVFYDTI